MIAWWEALSSIQRVLATFAIPATVVLIVQTVLQLISIGGHDMDADAGGANGMDAGMDTHGIDAHGMGEIGSHDIDLDGVGANGMDAPMGDAMGESLADHGHITQFGHGDHAYDTDSYAPDDADPSGAASLRLFTLRGIIAFFAVGGWLGIVLLDASMPTPLALLGALVGGTLSMYLIALFFKWAIGMQYNGTMRLEKAIGLVGQVYLTVPAQGQGSGKISLVLQESLRELDAVSKQDFPLPSGTPVRVVDVLAGQICVVEPV